MTTWTTAPEYLSILPKVRVLLMGSYARSFMSRIESIKKGLIRDGLINSRVTKDFSMPPQMKDEPTQLYNLRKSEYWIRHADVLFFIFFSGTDNASIGLELGFAVNPTAGNAWRTILAYQEDAPSLIVGCGIRFQREMSLIPFSDDNDLRRQAVGNVVMLLNRLYSTVLARPDGEWECASA